MRTSDLLIENTGFASPENAVQETPDTRLGFPVYTAETALGLCHTLVCGRIWEADSAARRRLSSALSCLLAPWLRDCRRVLIVGIGNPAIPADALGARTVERILVTGETGRRSVFAVGTGTPARTGIDTAVHVRALADALSPDGILAVDALSARTRERLQTVIQLSADGITPGSALAHTSGEISRRTMPCPVYAIGVPTVISSAALGDTEEEPLFVTRAASDTVTDCYASLLAAGINTAIFGK